MRTRIAIAALLLIGAAARAQTAGADVPILGSSQRWSLNTGETVAQDRNAVSVEAGWPGISLGYTKGLSDTTDIGARFDLLYGVESTTTTQFGLGFRVPYRVVLSRSGATSILVHADPGVKLYTTSPATFALQVPVGVALGYGVSNNLRVEVGADLPVTLGLSPSADLVLAPMVGGGVEYRVDRDLTVGLDTRFGPVFVPTASGAGTRFGFRTLVTAAYRL